MQPLEIATALLLGTYYGLLIVTIFFLIKRFRIHWYREKEYKKKKFHFENNVHKFYGIRQLLLIFFPLVFSITILGISNSWGQISKILGTNLLTLIVLGLSINVFWIIQLPLVMKANLVVDFSVDKVGDFNEDEILLKTHSQHIVYCRIYNAGYSTLKNATVLLYFERGVEIVPCDKPIYDNYDFVKDFSIQKGQCGISFNCLKNYLTIPPQEWFLFPIILKTKNALEQKINLQLYSESSWGITKHYAKMIIQ